MATLPENLKDIVYDAMSGTFEGLAFLELSPDEESLSDENCPSSLWARVDSLSPLQGHITVILPESLANEITASLFSISDGQIPPDKLRDSLGEIANTVAGRLMALLVSKDDSFKLSMPDFGKGFPSLSNTKVFSFLTDDERRLGIAIELK